MLLADTIELEHIKRIYTNYIMYYAYIGNVEKVKEYHIKYTKVETKIRNENFEFALSEMEVKYETEKKEMQIAALKSERQLMWTIGIVGGVAFLIIILALLFRQLWLKKRTQLVATQSVLDGETQERTRLARDLHDGLGSILSAAKLKLSDMKKGAILEHTDVQRFDQAIGMIDDSIREMRRVAHHLMPDSLSRFGLKTALTDFCNSIPTAEFNYYGNGQRFDRKLEVVVYRIVHELVNNALKYANASHILVQIVQEKHRLALTVEDNGVGFNTEAVTEGMGIQNIRTRVVSFGGTMDLRSSAEKGTEVNVEFNIIEN
jgi:signal transduction histidine kinase